MNEPNSEPAASSPYSSSDLDFAEADRQLAQTKPWVQFVSVLGFLTCAMVPLKALSAPLPAAVQWIVWPTIVVVAFLFYFIPSTLLWVYGTRIGECFRDGNSASFSEALAAGRAFWKYLGTVALVLILLYFVAIASFVALAMIGGMR